MNYNIYFEVAATGYVALLLLYLYKEYPNSSLSNKRFKQMAIWLLAADILDVITARTIEYGAVIPPAWNVALNTLYFLSSAQLELSFVKYLDSFLNETGKGLFYKVGCLVTYLYSALLIGNMFFGFMFRFDEKGTYIHGPLYFMVYAVLLVLCFFGVLFLMKHRSKLDGRQILATLLFVLIVMAAALLQLLLFPETLLTMYMGSLATMVFLYAIETPDYQKLQQTMKELEEAREEADEQFRKADEANRAKSLFLAKMSHEIRTPINAVIGMNEMILREEEDEQIQEYAMDVKSSADSLLSTINDILDLSKIESGKMELVEAEYDVSSLLHDVINMISMKAQDKNLKIKLSIDESLPSRLYGDDIRIRQILVNILNNAVKYTNEGFVLLSVKAKKDGDTVNIRVDVKDTGIGIRKEDIDRIFSVYTRFEEANNRMVEGTGLGMNITQQLLHMMGSELKVESVYGEGSRFFFDLKQKIVEEEPIGNLEERIQKQAKQHSYDASFIAPNAQILLVDDNSVNRRVCISLLKETQVQIDEASGGLECLEKVKKYYYDLILLDHMMPDLDGIDTLKEMQKLEDFPCKGIPVIALTANAITGAREMYLQAGFSDFLSKPIRPEKLEHILVENLPPELIEKVEISESEARRRAKQNKVQKSQEWLNSVPEIEGIDWEYAMLHMKKLDILQDTIQNFIGLADVEISHLDQNKKNLDQMMKQLEILPQQVEIQEIPDDFAEVLRQYRVCVHSMKTNAAMIGAVAVSSFAKMLEYAARDGRLDVIERLHQIFREQWVLLVERLNLAYGVDAREQGWQEKDVSDIIKNLELLNAAMEEYDVDVADEITSRLARYQYLGEEDVVFKELTVAVKSLDADKASECIQELRGYLEG